MKAEEKNIIENLNFNDLVEFYKTHAIGDIEKEFNLSRYRIYKLFDQYGIEKHSYQEDVQLNNLNHGNSFATKANKEFEELLKSINIDEFYAYYRAEGKEYTTKKYNISKCKVNKILDHFGLKHLTSDESRSINFIHEYGSIEEGKRILYNRIQANTDQEARLKKIIQTNQERYGGNSPFCSQEVRDKAKQTTIEHYGVENPFQSKEVKEAIKQISIERYGGIGWASPELRKKYNNIMLEKYGVEWGCLTEQCNSSTHSVNSLPNKVFSSILEANNIDFSKEFVLDRRRYDFKVGDNLIEINPTATHNIIWSPFGDHLGVSENYHYEKSLLAFNNGYRCIHIWDWDNIDKIVQLLLSKEKIYARKCELKLVRPKEAKEFIDKYHLQGSTRSDGSKNTIRLGLYYNEELVSIMTFGKPRYNKNYEYELLRFCSSYVVIGGAEKLFKYFLKVYDPKSIISYCDFSKFTGKTYEKLGFKELSIGISKHWYSQKTEKHITDNLLRQQGFDRLLGDIYGTFGKGSSNEELMLQHNFLEVCDAGQKTYVYNNI